jgi:hypothetical protein
LIDIMTSEAPVRPATLGMYHRRGTDSRVTFIQNLLYKFTHDQD